MLAGVTLLSAIISPTATTEAPERLPGARVTHTSTRTHHEYTRTNALLASFLPIRFSGFFFSNAPTNPCSSTFLLFLGERGSEVLPFNTHTHTHTHTHKNTVTQWCRLLADQPDRANRNQTGRSPGGGRDRKKKQISTETNKDKGLLGTTQIVLSISSM